MEYLVPITEIISWYREQLLHDPHGGWIGYKWDTAGNLVEDGYSADLVVRFLRSED